MATYTNITADEMREFLTARGFFPLLIPGTRELVYSRLLTPDLSLRVYTGINPTGESRAAGEDAIRCETHYRYMRDDVPVVRRVATSKRVHRVERWRVNLDDRLATMAAQPRTCSCGAPMMKRQARNGRGAGREFYGCVRFPDCKNTESA